MKPAVFEIDETGGQARLVCVSVATLGEAVELEEALRLHVPHMHIRLLGRFDSIKFASNLEELMDAVAADAFVCQGRFEGLMRRLIHEPTNQDAAGRKHETTSSCSTRPSSDAQNP
jgi:hypothetical protein